MWDALDIGSAPIQVLEPGCGTGNFMAGIPENIKANVSGVELDPISARIAAALNPDATILNADLADCTIHPGFDLTICFASMFVRQVRQCFSAVWADGFPRCRHRFPVM